MRNFLSYIFFLGGLCLLVCNASGQQLKLGNNPTQINKAAVLELQSWNQGLRLSRVDTTAVNAIINTLTPALKDSVNGMIVYQTSDSSIYLYAGGYWRRLAIADSIGITSINGDKTKAQTFTVENGSYPNLYSSPRFIDDSAGNHILHLPFASGNIIGIVSYGDQTWYGQKRFSDSIGVESLSPGSVPFIGSDPYNYLSEDNSHLYWDNINRRLGIGTNAPGSTLDVNGTGRFANSLTLGQDLIANGSSGTNGNVLRSRGAVFSPIWESIALDSLSNVQVSSPSNGDLLQYNGTKWINSSGNGAYWSLTGNSNTNSGTNFIGTNDNQPLIFKAGTPYVNSTQVGYLGFRTSAGGDANVIFGDQANITNSGKNSVAIGYSAKAQESSVAIGNTAKANSSSSVAIGVSSTSGDYSVAIGPGATNSGNSSIAIGRTANAATTALAFGNGAKASATPSMALGNGATASNVNAIAIGSPATANGNNATALGYKAQAMAQNSTAIGSNAYAWNKNTLILGDTIYSIKVGIGTNDPSYNLDVNGTGNFSDALTLGRDIITNGSSGTNGQVLTSRGAGLSPQWQNTANGTVTSVGLSMPSIFSVSNSPVTGSGTLTATLISQTKNNVFAAPSGSDGIPSFRPLVLADLPDMGLGNLSDVTISSPSNGQVLQYNGTKWVNATASGGSGWLLSGNGGTDSSKNYLGTSDYQPLVIKVNNQQVGYFGTTSGGSSNIAFGLNASAGYQSIAFGYNATNTGNQSVTLGYGANSTSDYTITIGAGTPVTTTSSNNSIAIGVGVSVKGYKSTAIGNGASANGQQALSLGSGAVASAYLSTAIGDSAQATQQNSTAIGNGAIANVANTLILGNGANVGIGTSNPGTYKLYVSGNIYTTGTVTQGSDMRYKKNLQELNQVLSALDSLHGYTYFFRTNQFKDKNFPSTKQIGMIAQEVEKYFPELVLTDKNGYKSLNYAQFTAVLLEAVKEQQTEIKELKKADQQQKETVSKQIQTLKERLDKLEKLVNDKK